MIVSPHPQRSEEWHKERLSLPTASCFEKLVHITGERAEPRKKYLYELASEAVTGRPTKRFVNAKMRGAVEREPDARLLYEILFDVEVQEVGLCYPDELKKYGYSPDGLVEEEGLLEIKDAEPHVQALRLLDGWSRAMHFQQCQGGLFVTGRKWCDLMSYCERMTPVIIRYYPDYKFFEKLEIELNDFCLDLAIAIRKLKERRI